MASHIIDVMLHIVEWWANKHEIDDNHEDKMDNKEA